MFDVFEAKARRRGFAFGSPSNFDLRTSDFSSIHQPQTPGLTRMLVPDDGDAELLGVGRNALKKLKFLQNSACAFSDGAQGIIGDVDRQAGFLGDEPVNAAQERATSGHHNTSIHQIGGQFRGTAFQRNADGLQYLRERFLEGFAYFFGANVQGFRQSCAQIAALYFHG